MYFQNIYDVWKSCVPVSISQHCFSYSFGARSMGDSIFVEVRGQLLGPGSLLLPCEFEDWTLVIRLDGKYILSAGSSRCSIFLHFFGSAALIINMYKVF